MSSQSSHSLSPSTPPTAITSSTTAATAAPPPSSTLRAFLARLAGIPGDLSNITAPPSLLAPYSTTTLPRHWASDPSLLLAPTLEADPARRALAVLKWWLACLRGMNYGDVDHEESVEDGDGGEGKGKRKGKGKGGGIKKPLNAFLGELFLARWGGGESGHQPHPDPNKGVTRLVSEQVGHHPPVTACCLWNEQAGWRAEGYTAQEITFDGSVLVRQIGHAILRLEKWEEEYLIPLPDVRIKGLLTGSPYPELSGTYHLAGSGGFVGEVKFQGKGLLGGGTRNAFHAELYSHGDKEKVLFSLEGQWSGKFTIRDEVSGVDIETYDTEAAPTSQLATEMHIEDPEAQDPWESQRAWRQVIDGLQTGNTSAAGKAKSILEQGQRDMRKAEAQRGESWKPLFFVSNDDGDPVFTKLAALVGGEEKELHADKTMGVWKLDWEKVKTMNKPFHGDLLPDNTHDSTTTMNRETKPDSSLNESNMGRLNLNVDAVEQQQQPEATSSSTSSQLAPHPPPSQENSSTTTSQTEDVHFLPVDVEAQQREIDTIKEKEAAEAAEREKIENFLRSRYSS